MTTEEWRQVIGFEGYYEVSNQGRVRRPDGSLVKAHPGNRVGHLRVQLNSPNRARAGLYVHTLVLSAFVGPRPEKMVACHNDGEPTNNRVENLRWDTYSENNLDIVRHGHHYHVNRTHCPRGHLLDGSNDRQRFCTECRRERGRTRRATVETCPNGHEFDGLRMHGGVAQRYCTRCTNEALDRGRKTKVANKTHCPKGHPLNGVRYRPDGSVKQRYCKTCLRLAGAARRAAAKQ